MFKPVQRVMKTTLSLQDLVKYTPHRHPDYQVLRKVTTTTFAAELITLYLEAPQKQLRHNFKYTTTTTTTATTKANNFKKCFT